MKHLYIAVLVGVMFLLTPGIQPVAQADKNKFKADLTGYEEVPAVSSTGNGQFRAKVNKHDLSLDYEISYQNLEGNVTQSHIHFGNLNTAGGVSIWLCQTAASPAPAAVAASTPFCTNPLDPLDTHSGMAAGTVDAADVIGPAGQGIAAGEFAEILQAIRDGVAYANVHSSRNAGGEVRGQIK